MANPFQHVCSEPLVRLRVVLLGFLTCNVDYEVFSISRSKLKQEDGDENWSDEFRTPVKNSIAPKSRTRSRSRTHCQIQRLFLWPPLNAGLFLLSMRVRVLFDVSQVALYRCCFHITWYQFAQPPGWQSDILQTALWPLESCLHSKTNDNFKIWF